MFKSQFPNKDIKHSKQTKMQYVLKFYYLQPFTPSIQTTRWRNLIKIEDDILQKVVMLIENEVSVQH